MSERTGNSVEEPFLEEVALAALAEIYATPPSPALRERVLGEVRRAAAVSVARKRLQCWRLVAAGAVGAALAFAAFLFREMQLGTQRGREISMLAQTNAALISRLEERTAGLEKLKRSKAKLGERLAEQSSTVTNLRAALARQVEIMRVLGGARTLTVGLESQHGNAGSAFVFVDEESCQAAVVAEDLAPAGEGNAYELWVIRGSGSPEPSGLFSVEGGGLVAARLGCIERPSEISVFAVSIEPAMGSEVPTGPLVLAGSVVR